MDGNKFESTDWNINKSNLLELLKTEDTIPDSWECTEEGAREYCYQTASNSVASMQH